MLPTSKPQWPKNNKGLRLIHSTSLMGPLKAVSIVLCQRPRVIQQLISGTRPACCGGRKEKKNVGGHRLAIKRCNSEVTYWSELFTPSNPLAHQKAATRHNLPKFLEGRRNENNLRTALTATWLNRQHSYFLVDLSFSTIYLVFFSSLGIKRRDRKQSARERGFCPSARRSVGRSV